MTTSEPVRAAKYADPYAWSATTIGYILKRPEYMGRKVLGKTVCENYKTKSSRKTAPEEQYTFEGAIPAIVDVETWQTVQNTGNRAPRPEPFDRASLLRRLRLKTHTPLQPCAREMGGGRFYLLRLPPFNP